MRVLSHDPRLENTYMHIRVYICHTCLFRDFPRPAGAFPIPPLLPARRDARRASLPRGPIGQRPFPLHAEDHRTHLGKSTLSFLSRLMYKKEKEHTHGNIHRGRKGSGVGEPSPVSRNISFFFATFRTESRNLYYRCLFLSSLQLLLFCSPCTGPEPLHGARTRRGYQTPTSPKEIVSFRSEEARTIAASSCFRLRIMKERSEGRRDNRHAGRKGSGERQESQSAHGRVSTRIRSVLRALFKGQGMLFG